LYGCGRKYEQLGHLVNHIEKFSSKNNRTKGERVIAVAHEEAKIADGWYEVSFRPDGLDEERRLIQQRYDAGRRSAPDYEEIPRVVRIDRYLKKFEDSEIVVDGDVPGPNSRSPLGARASSHSSGKKRTKSVNNENEDDVDDEPIALSKRPRNPKPTPVNFTVSKGTKVNNKDYDDDSYNVNDASSNSDGYNDTLRWTGSSVTSLSLSRTSSLSQPSSLSPVSYLPQVSKIATIEANAVIAPKRRGRPPNAKLEYESNNVNPPPDGPKATKKVEGEFHLRV
jgi:hypothetical protein